MLFQNGLREIETAHTVLYLLHKMYQALLHVKLNGKHNVPSPTLAHEQPT